MYTIVSALFSLALVVLVGFTSTSAATGIAAEQLARRLDAAIDHAIAENRVVGTVVVVLQNGHAVYRRAAGLADRETGTSMRVEHIFRLASVSKPIVTAAALRLVDEDHLSLDDFVSDYLPDFRPRLADGKTSKVTIRQLMTHTAGLSYGFFEEADGPYHRAGVSDGLDQPGLSMADELSRINAAGLKYAPGSAWGYSVAIDVLGAVVERLTAQPLPKSVEDLVTKPLGMTHTGFTAPDPADLAVPYADGNPPVRMEDPHIVPFGGLAGISYSPSRVFDPQSFPSGGAGMNGTADDVARFLEAMRTGGGGVLKPSTAASMLINQTGGLPIVTNGPGWEFGFGGAVLIDPAAAKTPHTAGTWTWGGAWGHNWFVDPSKQLVVVAFTNTAVEGVAGQFVSDIRDAVYGLPEK